MLKTILELSYNTIIFQLINCCTKCAYKYGKWSCLEPHHILHTGENPYQCVVCKVNFVVTHILNLTTDKRPHELFDISVFVCIICDLKSEQWYHLKDHLNSFLMILMGKRLPYEPIWINYISILLD